MDLAGVFPPIPTPFRPDDGTVDVTALARNTDHWVTTGVRGIVALGSNGEAPLLDESESDLVIQTVRERVPAGCLVIAGTGRESTKASTEASRRAASVGADAVLVRTPSYFKTQMTSDAFVSHYSAVADASPVPVILYNFTAVTGVSLPVDAVVSLAQHPNVVGIKESGSDLGYVGSLIDETPDGFQVLVGSAPTFFASLMCGAAGGILALASVVPDLCVELFEFVGSRRYDEARLLQQRLTPLARLVTRVYGVPGLKAALDLLGLVGGPPRPPLHPVGPDAVAALGHALEALGVPSRTAAPVGPS